MKKIYFIFIVFSTCLFADTKEIDISTYFENNISSNRCQSIIKNNNKSAGKLSCVSDNFYGNLEDCKKNDENENICGIIFGIASMCQFYTKDDSYVLGFHDKKITNNDIKKICD